MSSEQILFLVDIDNALSSTELDPVCSQQKNKLDCVKSAIKTFYYNKKSSQPDTLFALGVLGIDL